MVKVSANNKGCLPAQAAQSRPASLDEAAAYRAIIKAADREWGKGFLPEVLGREDIAALKRRVPQGSDAHAVLNALGKQASPYVHTNDFRGRAGL